MTPKDSNRSTQRLPRWALLLGTILAAIVLLVACTDEESGLSVSDALERFAEPGEYGVGVSTLTLVDDSRPTDPNGDFPGSDERTLEVEVWYPTPGEPEAEEVRDAPVDPSEAPYPLIVFSHGFTGSRRQSTSYSSHLASHGYVVVSPDYPLSSGGAPGGPRLGDVVNQPGDVSFLIDGFLAFSQESGNPFEGAVDSEDIGLTGHSLGGLTTILATYGPLADDRVDAAVPLAGPACLVGASAFDDSRTPLLVIGGSEDRVVPWASVRQAYDQANAPRFLVQIVGGNHLRFADLDFEDPAAGSVEALAGESFLSDVTRVGEVTDADLLTCLSDGADESSPAALSADRQRELTRLFATAFFDHYLKGDVEADEVFSTGFADGISEISMELDPS
jgi:predicted dienelactone hydrolase